MLIYLQVLLLFQVELSLLAYTLNIKLRIVHPKKVGTEDYIAIHPQFGADHLPVVNLLAEDEYFSILNK